MWDQGLRTEDCILPSKATLTLTLLDDKIPLKLDKSFKPGLQVCATCADCVGFENQLSSQSAMMSGA